MASKFSNRGIQRLTDVGKRDVNPRLPYLAGEVAKDLARAKKADEVLKILRSYNKSLRDRLK